jgi:LuxR family transcriptional regulator, glucitol operon activator
VGKTALALKAAYDLLDLPNCPFEAVVWTTSKTKQLTTHEVREIEGAISDSLGMCRHIAHQLAGETADDPFEEVLSYLQTFRILLILDNLETVLDSRLRQFLARLPVGSKVLVTSRIGLGALDFPIKLEPMEAAESIQLLRGLATIRGVSQLVQMPNSSLVGYCNRMKHNPAYIKWFVSAVQVGVRPEDALAKSDTFLDFCMSNVYGHLSEESRSVLNAMLCVQGRQTQAELAFIVGMAVLDFQKALQQLLTTSMIVMSSAPRGLSYESYYSLSELARSYLLKYHPVASDERKRLICGKQQLVAVGERVIAQQTSNPYSLYNIVLRSRHDRIVAKYLLDALNFQKRSQFAGAEEAIERARQLSPDYFEVHRVDAWIKANQNDVSGAQTAYEAAIEREPSHAPLRVLYGGFLMRCLDDVGGALAQLREAEKTDPPAIVIQLEIARATLYLRQHDECRRIIDALIARKDLSRWEQRKVYDLHLQYFQRRADHLMGQHDELGALGSLCGLRNAYEACPPELLDDQMKRALRKSVRVARSCAHHVRDEQSRSLATDLAAWLTGEAGWDSARCAGSGPHCGWEDASPPCADEGSDGINEA